MANKQKQLYEIDCVKYVKIPLNGQVYPKDANPSWLAGKRKYSKAKKQKISRVKTTWGEVKKKAYEDSKAGKVYATWRTPKPQLVKVTKELDNGVKEITYFNSVKKGK